MTKIETGENPTKEAAEKQELREEIVKFMDPDLLKVFAVAKSHEERMEILLLAILKNVRTP